MDSGRHDQRRTGFRIGQRIQFGPSANARSAATEAWTRRLEREEVEAYLSPTTVVSTGLASVVH